MRAAELNRSCISPCLSGCSLWSLGFGFFVVGFRAGFGLRIVSCWGLLFLGMVWWRLLRLGWRWGFTFPCFRWSRCRRRRSFELPKSKGPDLSGPVGVQSLD